MRLGGRDDLDPSREEVLHDRNKMAQAPPQAIEPPDENPGEAALVGVDQELGEFRPARGGARNPGVDELRNDRPAPRGGQCSQLPQLHVGVLLGRADSRVQGHAEPLISAPHHTPSS